MKKTIPSKIIDILWIAIGAFLAALAIRVFIFPNYLIDGGVIGIALILARLIGGKWLSLFIIFLNLPFIYMAYKHIRRSFVIHMFFATVVFALFLAVLESAPPFQGDLFEIVVIGGAMLGAGAGLIIRNGGCTDGTEILAIILNRKKGYTVGQIILFFNIFIFGAYGLIFMDWHIALQSLLVYVVAFKMIDTMISGLDELKSVMIVSSDPERLSKLIMHEMGLGLTIIKGRGGYSGEDRDILMVILERLDLSTLKEIVLREDPLSFMAIENLHEVAYGKGISGDKGPLKKMVKQKKI